jgi:hypothetical protein
MADAGFQFVLVLFREDDDGQLGQRLGQLPITPDWEPAFAHLRFWAIRRELRPPVASATDVCVRPVWHARLGEPFLDAFDLTLDGEPVVTDRLPTAYLAPLARQAVAALIASGVVAAADRVRFLVAAQPGASDPAPDADAWLFEDVAQPLQITDRALPVAVAREQGPLGQARHVGDLPILIPQAVIDQTHALSRAAATRETGGILLGQLHRDPDTRTLFLRITAQLPARHTVATETRLTFTEATWAAARQEVAARQRGELLANWWHFHPWWCRPCPPARRATCTLDSNFFSADDLQLHRVVFSQAYATALLISDGPTGLTTTLFGWRQGTIVPREFHVVRAPSTAKGDLTHGPIHTPA